MEISVSEFISLLKAFNKDNNGIVAIKTGESEKTKPESFLKNQIVFGVGGEYIPEGEKDIPPTVTVGGFGNGIGNTFISEKQIKDQLYGEIRTLDNENVDLKRKLDISQKENQKLKNEIDFIRGEFNKTEEKYLEELLPLRKKYFETEKENEELKNKLAQIKKVIDDLQDEDFKNASYVNIKIIEKISQHL